MTEDRALSRADVWVSKIPGSDICAVASAGGDVGYVRKFFRTIEKEISGERYVAWRRKAKSPSWRYWLKGEAEPGGRYAVSTDTREQAINRILADLARRGMK